MRLDELKKAIFNSVARIDDLNKVSLGQLRKDVSKALKVDPVELKKYDEFKEFVQDAILRTSKEILNGSSGNKGTSLEPHSEGDSEDSEVQIPRKRQRQRQRNPPKTRKEKLSESESDSDDSEVQVKKRRSGSTKKSSLMKGGKEESSMSALRSFINAAKIGPAVYRNIPASGMERVEALSEAIKKMGFRFKGIVPTPEETSKVKKTRDRERELDGMDISNILEDGGRPKRRATKANYTYKAAKFSDEDGEESDADDDEEEEEEEEFIGDEKDEEEEVMAQNESSDGEKSEEEDDAENVKSNETLVKREEKNGSEKEDDVEESCESERSDGEGYEELSTKEKTRERSPSVTVSKDLISENERKGKPVSQKSKRVKLLCEEDNKGKMNWPENTRKSKAEICDSQRERNGGGKSKINTKLRKNSDASSVVEDDDVVKSDSDFEDIPQKKKSDKSVNKERKKLKKRKSEKEKKKKSRKSEKSKSRHSSDEEEFEF